MGVEKNLKAHAKIIDKIKKSMVAYITTEVLQLGQISLVSLSTLSLAKLT